MKSSRNGKGLIRHSKNVARESEGSTHVGLTRLAGDETRHSRFAVIRHVDTGICCSLASAAKVSVYVGLLLLPTGGSPCGRSPCQVTQTVMFVLERRVRLHDLNLLIQTTLGNGSTTKKKASFEPRFGLFRQHGNTQISLVKLFWVSFGS